MIASHLPRFLLAALMAAAVARPAAASAITPRYRVPAEPDAVAARERSAFETLRQLARAPGRLGQLPTPEIAHSVRRLVLPPPPALVGLARAVYSALGEPRIPAELFALSVPVPLYNVNTRETMTFRIDLEGNVAEAEQAQLTKLFRCRRTGKRRRMDPGILRILAQLARHYPGHTIQIVSGYRAPPYGVPHSKHFHGRAIDLRVEGVPLSEVRDFLWTNYDHVGVGYYLGQEFVHVDHRPRDSKTAWTSARPGARYRYDPPWARQTMAAR
jgi:uncharacterized protein YcbK (DUF882 family)